MVQCANGSQPQSGAPTWAWLIWSSFLAWLTTHYARFGNIVWIFFPDAPVNIADFCATEVDVPSAPALLTWVKAFAYDALSQLEVGNYLIQSYKAAVWSTYCECKPLTGTGSDPYSDAVLADGPAFYYKTDDTTGTTIHDSSPNNRDGLMGNTAGATSNSMLHQAGPFTGWYSAGGYTGGCGESITINRTNWRTSAIGTFEGWFHETGIGLGGQMLFSYFLGSTVYANGLNWNRFGDHKFSLPTWSVSFNDTSVVGLADSAWHYLVLSWDGTSERFYYDGALVATVATSIAVPIVSGSVISFGASSTNSYCGQISRLAYYDFVLSGAQVAAHYAAAGGVPFTPVYTPPTPSDPTALPDRTDPTCSTTADLCTAIARLQAIQMTTQREVNWIQSSQSPTGWSPLTTATGLTGAGTLAVTDIVGIFVDISIPSRWGRTAETPYRSIPEVGSVAYSIDGVISGRYGLHYAQEQIFGAPPAATAVVYNLRPGVSASITPLGRLK